MTRARDERLSGFGWRLHRDDDAILRLLRAIGADPAFADDVLGDLTQERRRRGAEHGAMHAGLWYLGQAVRAMPHLAWNAVRHGGARGRTRVAATAAGVVMAPLAALWVITTFVSDPVRLVVDGQRGRTLAEGLIVNSRRPVRLSATAFNASGHSLGARPVHYAWTGGIPLDVTSDGVITCSQAGDATVRATAGRAAADLVVNCRPVEAVSTYRSILLVAGDSARNVAFLATGPSGEMVWELAGERRVGDTSVARMEGNWIRGLKAGYTEVGIRMGDGTANTKVTVFEPVPSLAGLRPDQHLVIAPVNVPRGDTLDVPLPVGKFWLKYHRLTDGAPMPRRVLTGPVSCVPRLAPPVDRAYCTVTHPGAVVHVSAPHGVEGKMSIEFDHFLHI